MVFTSLPLYLDPPNWNQQNHNHHHQSGGGGGGELQQAIQVTPPVSSSGNGGSIRPVGSMSDRARMARIPCLQPELQALKCPRCDSANTKFCYFNNYSLSQPRHFCKACRRYWTRGGALRNVPVGGGCRRNNKPATKSSKSSSATATANAAGGGASSSSTSSSSATSGSSTVTMPSHYPGHLPYLASLHAMSEYGSTPNLGLHFAAAMQPNVDVVDHAANYQLDQWRIQQLQQQFPFLGGLASSSSTSAAVMTTTAAEAPVGGSIYNPFDGAEHGFNRGEVVLPKETSSALITQLASVKMEDSSNPRLGLNLARQYLGNISGNDHYWSGGGGGGGGGGGNGVDTNSSSWAPGELSGFNSSSSGNIL